jgi:hypothetical protein
VVIVEDGVSQNPAANSYVSEADLAAYVAARGITLVGDPTQLLIKAIDYIDSLLFIGSKRSYLQPLQWPRAWRTYYPVYFFIDIIPRELKKGQLEAAIAISQGNDPLQDIQRATHREKVGDLEVEYNTNAVSRTSNRRILAALQILLVGGGFTMPVGKG